ncbi:MAG TPA: hypothetical protein VII74_00225, partial [Chthoniobacterales bacterium]
MTNRSRRSVLLLFVFLFAATAPILRAQSVHSIAEREVARRQAGVLQGESALAAGQLALNANNFARAHDEFRTAVNFLPDALTTADKHD